MRTLKELTHMAGRRALVTGATGHIGRTACELLHELGATVLILDRDADKCHALAEELGQAHALPCDLGDLDAVKRSGSEAAEGGLDVLIHCAAFVGTTSLPGWATTMNEQTVDAWNQAFAVNVSSLFVLAQACRDALAATGRGTILAVSSIYGQVGPDMRLYDGTAMGNPTGYGVTKGGLVQLMRYLATTYAPEIRVNAISPGGIARGQTPSFVDRYEARTPMKRMGTEEDMKGAIAYFCTDMSLYTTGQDLAIDGGWTAW